MKFLKTTLLITIISLFTFSCSSDDSSSDDNISKLIGSWLLTGETENGVALDLDECDDIITFTNTEAISTYYYGDNCSLSEEYTQTYTLNGDIISTVEDGETFSITIVSLNNTTLILGYSDEEDGTTYTYRDTYTKQ